MGSILDAVARQSFFRFENPSVGARVRVRARALLL
jgi:hypothetical protein